MSKKTNKTRKWNYGDYTYWYLDGSGEIIGQSIGGDYAFVQNLSFGTKGLYDFVVIPSNAKKLPKWKGDWNKEQGWYEAFQEQMERYKLKETA
jgi:hypothetical protein